MQLWLPRHVAAAILLFTLPCAVEAGQEPRRWALLIGISDYAEFSSEPGGDLKGAAADARRMQDVLVERWGFEPEYVRILLDSEATRAAIQGAMTEWLPSVAGDDDLVVIYFAGHGAQAWDLDGDEADGLDETIAPHDVLRTSSEHDVLDDELAAWLARLPTRNVVVILDNCHAGTGTRAAAAYARARVLARPLTALTAPVGVRSAGAGAGTDARPDHSALELAASQSAELAVETAWPQEHGDPEWGGAFTTLLVRQLWSIPDNSSWMDLFRLTSREMTAHGFAQQPRISLETELAQHPILRTGGIAARDLRADESPDPGLPLWLDAQGVPIVGGGAAAGLRSGMLLDGAGTLLRVTDVLPDRAHTELVRGSLPTDPATLRFRPVAAPLPYARLHLFIPPESPLAASGIGTHSGVAIETRLTPATTLIAEAVPGGYDVLGRDGAVRHALRGTGSTVLAELARVLEREYDTQQLAALDNPAERFHLELALPGGSQPLHVGAEVSFTVRAGVDGFLTLVDLGTDGAVTLLYPGAGMDGAIRAGSVITIPTEPMRKNGVVFVALPPSGTGMVRAFLTTHPLPLLTDAEGRLDAAAVLRALREVAGGGPLHDAQLIALDSWATDALTYTVQP